MPVYGDHSLTITPEDESEFVDWCRHFHWIDFHRICAFCGKLVQSGELDLMVNSGSIKIDKSYTDEYKKVKQGDRFGHLLIVHEQCINKGNYGS